MRADNFEVRRGPWASLEGEFAYNARVRCSCLPCFLLQLVLLRCASPLVRRLPRELYGSTCCRTGAWIGRRSWKNCSSSMTPRARRSWRRWLVGRRDRTQRNQCNRAAIEACISRTPGVLSPAPTRWQTRVDKYSTPPRRLALLLRNSRPICKGCSWTSRTRRLILVYGADKKRRSRRR